MIRHIELNDVPALCDLAKIMHAEGRYNVIPFQEHKFLSIIENNIKNGSFVGFVAEKDGNIVGAVAGYVCEYFFSYNKILCDYGVFVLPTFRNYRISSSLIRHFVNEGIAQGVSEICMGSSNMDDPEVLDALYAHCGLRKVGSIYKKSGC